jgi:hypothetical protein
MLEITIFSSGIESQELEVLLSTTQHTALDWDGLFDTGFHVHVQLTRHLVDNRP